MEQNRDNGHLDFCTRSTHNIVIAPTLQGKYTMETEETKQPSFISNRPVRILIFGVVAIVACVILVGVAVTVLKTSRNGPISVDTYPGAQLLSNDTSQNNDISLYSTQDSVQQVL